MSLKLKSMSLILCSCLLFGCTTSNNQNSLPQNSTQSSTEESSTKPAEVTYEKAELPVLSIQTKNQDANVLDFVTEPVATHVAEAIASWTPGYQIPPAPYYEACSISLTNADQTAALSNVDAEVKVRGNWTTTYDKKPLRIKFAEKQNLLGLNDGAEMRNWVLLAGYKDASMLRDKAALEIARELLGKDGLYAADAEFVEVYINEQYWGIYLLTELQQVNKDRVDISEPEADYTGTDIGYFLEFDGYFYNEDPLHQFHVDYADNAKLTPYDGQGGNDRSMCCLPITWSDNRKDVGFTIKSEIYSQEQHDFIASYVNNVFRILYAAAYEDKAYVFNDAYTEIEESTQITPQQAVEAVINVDSLADMYLISELTCDADIYWSSFYMDVDFGAEGSKKLTFEAPWDFDSGLGNKDRCADGTGFYAANIVPDVDGGPQNGGYYTINPWLAVLMYEDWYQDIIREKWSALYDSGVLERTVTMVQKDAAQYADAFTKNYGKWDNIRNNDSFAMELSKQAANCKNHTEASAFLAEWLQNRISFLNEHWHK